jgi:flavin-dependent dehydrogenase
MVRESECDVLIVGLGPVGAALGVLLIDQGLRVVAIDKD